MSLRQTIALVLLFVATSVTFIALDNRAALDPLKTGLQELVSPVTSFVNGIGDRSESDLAVELDQVTRERDALLAENTQLKLRLQQMEKYEQILDVKEGHPEWTLVTAKVLNPDPTSLQKFVTIDKGSADGIRKGMAVVDPYYFVGLVTAVEEHTARVTLAIDASAAVGAQLLESKADGVVYGRWQSGGRMDLAYVDLSVTPKPGELVVTSTNLETRTSQVPGGIIIGKVEGTPQKNNQGDAQTIRVLPAADFDHLNVVAVIVDDGEPGV
ncbi:MAG TPA: rod shape-determining protein MreC [Thermomicrobiales bacterium]